MVMYMKLEISSEEKHFLNTVAVPFALSMGGDSEQRDYRDVNALSSVELQCKAEFCISDKRYDLAERLSQQVEKKAKNIIDLHFCYNTWINLTYKQREDTHYLNLCIEYCKKDISMFSEFKRAYLIEYPSPTGFLDIILPSFERLCIIYEKSGMIEEAIKLCELAILHKLIDSTKGGFAGRLERLKKKSK